MNWVLGIYGTCTVIWGAVWGVCAAVAGSDWRRERDKSYRQERAAKHRGNFLGSMVMLACTPVWPAPLLVFAYRGIRVVVNDFKRAVIEEVAEQAKIKDR